MNESKLHFNEVDLQKPFFVVSHGQEWKEVALISGDDSNNVYVSILVHGADDKVIIDEVLKEIDFYLFDLENRDALSYLAYYCTTISNCMGNVHFSFCEQIDSNNLIRCVILDARQRGTYNTAAVSTLHEQYLDIMIDALFDEALQKGGYDADQYNNDLLFTYRLLIKDLPTKRGFDLHEQPTIDEFSKMISGIDNAMEFCNVLIYLKKQRLVMGKEIDRLLHFYYKHQNRQ